MSHELDLFLRESIPELENELKRHMPVSSLEGSGDLNRAIQYALFPGGKRMRPLFTLLAAHTAGGDRRSAFPVACAVEYLHTCSLILDDLPCMDRALERRGRRPTHLEFSESTAILAAVALLNCSWTLLLRNDSSRDGSARTKRLVEQAVRCIGPDGIIGGQFLDLAKKEGTLNTVPNLLKTASTTRFMLSSGSIVADAPEQVVEALAAFGEEIGSVYQILDDVIDGEAEKASSQLQSACSRLDRSMEDLHRFFSDGAASLLLEFTDWIFRPAVERANECVRSSRIGGR